MDFFVIWQLFFITITFSSAAIAPEVILINYTCRKTLVTSEKNSSRRILPVWNSLPANTDFSSRAPFRRTVYSVDLAKFLHCSND